MHVEAMQKPEINYYQLLLTAKSQFIETETHTSLESIYICRDGWVSIKTFHKTKLNQSNNENE